MKFRSLLVIGLLAALPSAAQDVLDRIAAESCVCLDDIQDLSNDDEQAQLGLCMMGKAMPYEKELRKKHNVDFSKGQEEGKRFGALVGARMATKCPQFAALIKQKIQRPNDDVPPPPPVATHEGTITEVLPGQFLRLVMREKDGRTIELLLLHHFPNADMLQGADVVNKKLRVGVLEQELYDAQTKTYRSFRVIASAETIE